ncbi:MAG: LPS export ABC transporter periplasmic protein LptC [Rickettsiaceae bacterium]|nr:LPS export ABC transporter periplasmic protein LptC [Rickettsiaceae bacterium]MDP4832107.1 LPS export ABC transporter periplasmic protein LptC [Rickettsiaceae bacterium]MDP5020303.1 LPS export ABC transporter periplasmic protein LptC [Rickettsiaceae bacterium]MDP5082623.1 LPS export ABC transporter periplasmic protein LptC [Rickettsiaceae bacterium]
MEHLLKTQARIKLIKYCFLSAGCCVLIAIVTTLYLKNISIQEDIKESSIQKTQQKLSKDYTLNINQSIFEGISSDLTPYKISAKTVTKDLENKYILSAVSGQYSLTNGDLNIKAAIGTLDEDQKLATLTKDVEITVNGIIFNSEKIMFNLENQEAYSDTEVEVNFNKSNIKADSFNTKNSHNIIEFNGNVESNFDVKDFE